MDDLTDDERAMLRFEKTWWKYAGARDEAIVVQFGVTPTRYHQRLNALIDTPAALAAEPMVVRRLQRLREQRRAVRTGSCSRVAPIR